VKPKNTREQRDKTLKIESYVLLLLQGGNLKEKCSKNNNNY
jgi:hypothetical protein